MANLSSAHGTLTITAPTPEDAAEFVNRALKPWEESPTDYSPYLVGKPETPNPDAPGTIQYSFDACGRWTWEATLQHICGYIEEYQDGNYLAELAQAGKTITLEWDFSDIDESTETLYKATVITTYSPDGWNVQILELEDYDYTRENYIKLGFDAEDWDYDSEED